MWFLFYRKFFLVTSFLREWSIENTDSVRSIFKKNVVGMKLVVYTNIWTVLLIKLKPLSLVTLINYINSYVPSILLIIFWYYLWAPVANLWKKTHLERYVPVPLEQSLFLPNIQPHNWFMSATAQLENLYYISRA